MTWARQSAVTARLSCCFTGKSYWLTLDFHYTRSCRCDDGIGDRAADSPFMRYTAKPMAEGKYEIWRSVPRDERVFQLNDRPVGEAEYRAITLHDYRHDGGQFLNEVVVRKVLDDQLWRFNSAERPLRLQQFVKGVRRDHPLGGRPGIRSRRQIRPGARCGGGGDGDSQYRPELRRTGDPVGGAC